MIGWNIGVYRQTDGGHSPATAEAACGTPLAVTLEALAIEGFRGGTLSHHQASQLLGMSRFEFDGFLKGRHIHDHAYDVEDLEEDRETLRQLRAKGLLRG